MTNSEGPTAHAAVDAESTRVQRRRLLARWMLAGVLVPGVLGLLSWLCFEARLGNLFDALANLSLFSAPFWPFVLRVFQHRTDHGALALAVGGGAVLLNVLLYAAIGALHWRLRAQPTVNQWLWLTVVVGIGFSVLRFAALVVAFAGG
jgi:hypothetical protein